MDIIYIDSEYITLNQFLKIVSLISSGGQAKFFLENNDVYVNQIIESRRGKKIYDGDIIKIEDKIFMIKNEIK